MVLMLLAVDRFNRKSDWPNRITGYEPKFVVSFFADAVGGAKNLNN
jgi:hypothetical protein